ncbi:MAG: hypothetical protein V7746_05250 [Halioglobus sp.]
MKSRQAITIDQKREVLINPWEIRRGAKSPRPIIEEIGDDDYRTPAMPCAPLALNKQSAVAESDVATEADAESNTDDKQLRKTAGSRWSVRRS